VTTDPEHATLNEQGEINILFDLPEYTIVESAYLSITVNSEIIRISNTTIDGSDLAYLNNKITITGSELYDIFESKRSGVSFQPYSNYAAATDDDIIALDDSDVYDDSDISPDTDEELPDDDFSETDETDILISDDDVEADDTDTISTEDKTWADKEYEIKLTLEMDTSGNSQNNETDDSDTTSTTSTIPATVEKTITITFDNTAPGAPESAENEGGDGRIIFRVSPPVLSNDEHDSIGKYHVALTGLFDSNGTEIEKTIEYTDTVSSGSYDKTWEFTVSGKDGYELINNDTNDPKYIYKAVITAEDLAGNLNPDNALFTEAFAVTTYGFWSNYEKNGGKDDGGFCFVATAGFGSYFHPNVEILRNFRDSVLSKFSLGQKFIKFYYKNGKAPAKVIRKHPILRILSRAILMPLVIFAWFFTNSLGNIILFFWLGTLIVYFFRKKRTPAFIGIFLLFLFVSPNLQAIDGEVNFNSSFYYPEKIDKELPGSPIKDIGGDSLRYLPMLNFGLRIPLLKDYIRWTFTAGAGYTRLSGTSIKADGEKSADKSYMHLIPLTGETKLRPVYSFPVYPYASIGLDYYIWWIREHGSTAEEGGTFGFHGNFGLMISLNWLDPKSSRKLEKTSGISNTGLFVHYHIEKIDDFGKEKSMDLSCNRFEFGIIFEF
jgi:hypothetical protein